MFYTHRCLWAGSSSLLSLSSGEPQVVVAIVIVLAQALPLAEPASL